MMRRLAVFFLLSVISALAWAQTVDRNEFSDILNRSINFVDFAGTYSQVDTLDQILAIGRGMASGVRKDADSSGNFGNKYQVFHILGDPKESLKPADVVIFSPSATVDHIDNVRRIISSYLSASYGYSQADADILSVFITVYNAVHRGNLAFYAGRYKTAVLKVLTADKVGLGISYTEWPGKSQIVIPLSIAAASVGPNNNLSSVASGDLTGPEVVDTLRSTPGQGTAERQQMSNLMDRTVDQEQNAIDTQRAQLPNQQTAQGGTAGNPQNGPTATAPGTQGTARNGGNPGPAASPGTAANPTTGSASASSSPAPSPASSPGTSPSPSPQTPAGGSPAQTPAPAGNDLAAQQQALDQRQQQNNQLAQASQDLRQGTAQDLQNQSQASAQSSSPVLALSSKLSNGLIVSQALRINLSSGEILQKSETQNLLGRRFLNFGSALLALELNGASARLLLLSSQDLSVVKRGASVISPYSPLELIPGQPECLAIVQDSGEWYLGRFDQQLNLIARSAIAVDPVGALLFQGSTVLVQRKDGKIVSLGLSDLKVSQ